MKKGNEEMGYLTVGNRMGIVRFCYKHCRRQKETREKTTGASGSTYKGGGVH